MKKQILMLISILITVIISSSYSKNTILSDDVLLANNWYWYENGFENDWIVLVKFNKNNTFITPGQYGEDLTVIEGKYKLLNDILELEYYKYSGHIAILPPPQGEKNPIIISNKGDLIKTKCKLTTLKDSVMFQYCIQCENKKLLSRSDLLLKEGEQRIVDNIKVLTLGYKNAVAIDNVKIREKPSIESRSYKYQNGLYDKPKEFVPKGSSFSVLARTIDKYKINNWENYWYYVDIGGRYNEKGWVWMFGEFINLK